MRLRISIPVMLLILLLISFGVVTYFTWNEYKTIKYYADQINEKRVMDNIIANIRQTADYERLFQDLIKQDDYISGINAFTLNAQPITEGGEITDEQKDLFNKTARSVDANRPFKTETGEYLFMRIDPDGYENTGDEMVVKAKVKTQQQTIIEKNLLLIIPAGVGLGAILLGIILSILLIGGGLKPIRNLVNKVAFSIHKGKPIVIPEKGDNEVQELTHQLKVTTAELNEINLMLSQLAVTSSIDHFLSVMLRYFEKKGLRSIVIFNKKGGVFKTVAYQGYWEDEDSIKNFNAAEDELLGGGSELFVRIINNKDYAEINKFNQKGYLNIDIELFGSPSIYAPIISGEFINIIIGGKGNLEPSAKRILSIITSRWGRVLYGIIQNDLDNRSKTIDKEETKETISKPNHETQLPQLKDISDEEKTEDNEIGETETESYEAHKSVVEKMNEQTERYNNDFKKGILYAKEKDYRKALDKLVPLTKIKKDARLSDLVGKCYFNIGEFDNAIQQWEEALQMKPGDKNLQSYIKKARAKLEG
jgi:tetratricopeptide (TPR) repeat protein